MKATLPHMGSYSDLIGSKLSAYLGWDIVQIPSPSEKTIELGAKYMNELMCLPAKVTLGSFIEAENKDKISDLLMFDSCGQCRLKTYWILQERALRKLGYDVTVHPISLGKESPGDICAIDSSVPHWKAWWVFLRLIQEVKRFDDTHRYEILSESRMPKIGLVGEIYCYSDDTEILTENGWKLFRDVKRGEKVVQADPITLNLDLTEPDEIYSLDYKGKMVELKSKQIDLLVTANHRILCQTRNGERKIVRADALPDRAYIFKAGNWEGDEIEPKQFGSISITPEQFCKFMGIWLAEGSIIAPDYIERDSYGRAKSGYRKRYNIYITQKKEEIRRKIEELLQEIGITVAYSSGSYRFQNKELWEYLKQFGKSKDKFIPREIANANGKYLALFLEWFAYGDGYVLTRENETIRYKNQKQQEKTQCFGSSSKGLISGIQEILLKLNKQGNISINQNNDMYSIQVRKTNYAQVKLRHKEEIYCSKKVYSVAVDKKFVVVRRNGIACISGNTILEPAVNRRIVTKLEKLGCLVHNSLPLSYFIFKGLYERGWMKRKDMDNKILRLARKKAHEYFPKEIGGHGNESIIHTIYYAMKKFDGVIHILPFPCMPESTVAPVLDDIGHDYSIPLMRLIFDTQTGEAGLDTRLEAFADMLRGRKRKPLRNELLS